MKPLYIISLLCFANGISFSQSNSDSVQLIPKRIGIKPLLEFGSNIPFYKEKTTSPYFINESIKAGVPGTNGKIGISVDFKHKAGLELWTGYSGTSFREKRLFNALEESYGDSYLQGDLNQDVTNSGGRGNTWNLNGGNFYYIKSFKKDLALMGIVGMYSVRPWFTSYEFVTREPQTNYFTIHEFASKFNKRYLVYAGGMEWRKFLITSDNKTNLGYAHIGLRAMLYYGNFNSDYLIRHTNYLGQATFEEVTTQMRIIHLNLSLNFCLYTF